MDVRAFGTTSRISGPSDNPYDNSTYVFSDACQIDGFPDCNSACSGDFGQMFRSLQTLHNCVVFPNITHLASDFTTWGNQDEIVPRAKVQDLFGDVASEAANTSVRIIETCLRDYCLQLDPNGCELPDTTVTLYDHWYTSNRTQEYGYEEGILSNDPTLSTEHRSGYGGYLVSSICASIEVRLDSDVGGIGVSYPLSSLKLAVG